MKKVSLVVLLLIIISVAFSGCEFTPKAERYEIEHYESGYLTTIFNLDSTVAFMQLTTNEPQINIVSESTVEIRRGIGTGTWLSQFYNLNSRVLSEQYECSYYLGDDTIAFFEWTDGCIILNVIKLFSFESKRIECDIAISSANIADGIKEVFIQGKNEICIVYYDAENDFREKTVVLSLNID